MDIDTFWNLISRSGAHSSDQQDRADWLTAELARLSTAEIVQFQILLDQARRHADTWHLWGAAYQIFDGLCSEDGFWYFQSWLVGLGRDTFMHVAAEPDTLAEARAVSRLVGRRHEEWTDDEWPEWEALNYAAADAYEQVTGEPDGLEEALEARNHDSPQNPDPLGERWDFENADDTARRLPRISRMFPLTPKAERDRLGHEEFDDPLPETGQTEEEFLRGLGLR